MKVDLCGIFFPHECPILLELDQSNRDSDLAHGPYLGGECADMVYIVNSAPVTIDVY